MAKHLVVRNSEGGVVADLYFDNMIGDCSTYTVGSINTYISHNDAAPLLAHALLLSKTKLLGNTQELKNDNGVVKFVFTNHNYYFNIKDYSYGKVVELLASASQITEPVTTVEMLGWLSSGEFRLKIITINKSYLRQNTIEFPEGYTYEILNETGSFLVTRSKILTHKEAIKELKR